MKLVVLGSGYVGLVSGVCLAEIGHEVVCVDLDAEKVARISRGVPPIHESGLSEMLARNLANGRLTATTHLAEGMRGADVSMIAVGTPFDGRTIDLTQVRAAATSIAEVLKDFAQYHVVCIKSTVVPGTTALIGRTIAEVSGRELGIGFGVAMNPEFLAEGSAIQDFMHPDRIVIGVAEERAATMMTRVYAGFQGADVLVTNLATAEMIKYAANSFLATVISFANEIANLSAAVGGVDVVDVMKGVHLDRRLAPMLPAGRLRPGLLSFLYPGTGFGGSCFPKDVSALIAYGEALGEPMRVLRAVKDTNTAQPGVTVQLCHDELGNLAGKRIAVLGLAFKPGTDDVRDSPAAAIIRTLVAGGAEVVAHDPQALNNMRAALHDMNVEYESSLVLALEGADAVVLVTAWPEYTDLGRLLDGRRTPVIDGRRFLDGGSFARYRGIGLRASDP